MDERGRVKARVDEPHLDLDEVRLAHSDELRVGLHLLHVPGLHQRQSVHRPLPLDGWTDSGDGKKESKHERINITVL